MYARMYDYGQIVIRTHDHDQHNTGHGTAPEKEEHRTTGIKTKFVIAGRTKRQK